jgi:hypothetical protein
MEEPTYNTDVKQKVGNWRKSWRRKIQDKKFVWRGKARMDEMETDNTKEEEVMQEDRWLKKREKLAIQKVKDADKMINIITQIL